MKTTLSLVSLIMIAVGAAAPAFADDVTKDRDVTSSTVGAVAHKRHGSKQASARPKLHKTDATRLNNNVSVPDYYTIQRESQMKNSM